jgi:predicted nuclease with TOPRIM domain
MEQNEDFARLEQFVEKLIESHNQLKKEKNEMMAQMQERDLEITGLQEKIKNLQEDKSRIQNRVIGLIDKIDEWEKMLDLEEGGRKKSSGSGAPREQSKKSSSLFNVKPEHSSKPALR